MTIIGFYLIFDIEGDILDLIFIRTNCEKAMIQILKFVFP